MDCAGAAGLGDGAVGDAFVLGIVDVPVLPEMAAQLAGGDGRIVGARVKNFEPAHHHLLPRRRIGVTGIRITFVGHGAPQVVFGQVEGEGHVQAPVVKAQRSAGHLRPEIGMCRDGGKEKAPGTWGQAAGAFWVLTRTIVERAVRAVNYEDAATLFYPSRPAARAFVFVAGGNY